MNTKQLPWQVIRVNNEAFVCHDQIRSLGFFSTRQEAEQFAADVDLLGGEIVVREIRQSEN